jgi:hypothetical protein
MGLSASNPIQFSAIDTLPLVVVEFDSANLHRHGYYYVAPTKVVNLMIERGQTLAKIFSPYASNIFALCEQ